MKTGLLFGAGFSKDFGLPLVTEVTTAFKASEKYWSIENAARIRADGWPDEIAREVRSVLGRDEMHFEAILGISEFNKSAQEQTEIPPNFTHLSILGSPKLFLASYGTIRSQPFEAFVPYHKNISRAYVSYSSEIALYGSSRSTMI